MSAMRPGGIKCKRLRHVLSLTQTRKVTMSVQRLKIECKENQVNTAIQAAQEALNKTRSNQERATYVRQIMDDKYGPAWSCITGQDFGSEIPYLPDHFAFFTVDDVSFLVCKSTDNVKVM
ncbi:unnamed protein product [Mesocestoides corti]|uniref:Dynein light chain n=2 Tax=Mesocestoides corti TaxID=53468 RepID=A0A3P6G5U6_MESCO|nr:unnamed protein product [Mesocestoides corti]